MQLLTVENVLDRKAHYAKNNQIAVNCPWIDPDGFFVPAFFASISSRLICVNLQNAFGSGQNGIDIPERIYYDAARIKLYRELNKFNVNESSLYGEVEIDLSAEVDVTWDSINNLYILEKSLFKGDQKRKHDLAILRFEMYA